MASDDKAPAGGDVHLLSLDAAGKKTTKPEDAELGYQHTLMYGRYTSDLGEFAKAESKRLRQLELKRRRDEKMRKKEFREQYRNRYLSGITKGISFVWQKSFAKLGEDWIFLAILGVLMATISFVMDFGIVICNQARIWLFLDMNHHILVQYFAWIVLPIFLVLFSAGFVHAVAPQAIGSGIPELKTILRGVTLKEYLTFKTLIAKVVGLTASLGSGMPLGKEGPLVHIASIIATLLAKLQSFHGIYENESRNMEMLAAAGAVGAACCFAAPVGGVLMSIEITAVYFAVRNYWRGFFAAACSAIFFRLLAVWFQGHETIKPMFKTVLGNEFPYDPQELIIYALMGAVSGLIAASFVFLHRKYVLWMRGNKKLNSFLQKNRFIYPFIISWFIASLNFPLGFGQFIAGELTTGDQVVTLFSNFTWTKDNFTVEEASIVKHWVNDHTGIFINLFIFAVSTFFTAILASTLPVPSGNFIPMFKVGAALGRMVGEAMYLWFPNGLNFSGDKWPIVPGGYAVVGAAAVSGGVTRAVSIVVIVSEMTGEITYIIPILMAVLISNAVAGSLQPSFFDSISLIKKLPYLPDFIPSSSVEAYDITVRDFMVRDVMYIWYGMSYRELKEILTNNKQLGSFPLVETPDNMILLGSIPRHHLIKAIERHTGRERRNQVTSRWHRQAAARAKEELERKLFAEHRKPTDFDEERKPKEVPERRTSRFEVTPVPAIVTSPASESSNSTHSSVNDNLDQQVDIVEPGLPINPVTSLQTRPTKSILKKTDSFSLHNFGQFPSPFQQHYSTVTGAESRVRNAFHAIFQKSSTLQDADAETGLLVPTQNVVVAPLVPLKKMVTLPRERVIDMSPEEQKAWEEEQVNLRVDFSRCHIDAAPFQLVAKTTLLKVHSLFSLLGINHAYVTATGKLIGVVAMKELRLTIEKCNAGTFQPNKPEVSSDGEQMSNSPTEKSGSGDELDSTVETEQDTTDDERLN